MEKGIIVKDLCKKFGSKKALNHVSFHIEKGMFGLLGKNGAGKTTLMRILTTLLQKSSGQVIINGKSIEEAKAIRKIVGYLPQQFFLYPNMTVYEAMDYLGVLSNMSKKNRKEEIPIVLEKVNLKECHNVKVKALSGGMRQRLGIAQAILHDPEVLIVDEPTANLDPEERVRFRNLLQELGDHRIILLSTHIVEDVEKTCESIAILNEGSISYQGGLKAFINQNEGLEQAYMEHIGGLL